MGINRDRASNWSYAKVHKDVKPFNEVKLEHVLGLTVTSNSALDCDSKTGIIAYPAGCTIVFLSPYREKQTHLLNDSRKSVTCLTYSPDGRYLATGEYGHQPSIRIWDLSDNTKCCEFTDHKCGINCLVFSPNQKYLVSVGSQHDMIINVWDWKQRVKIGANKVSTKIKAVAFCETGDYFVTVGNRHVKFWYIQHSKQSLNKDQPGLIGRAAILGEQQNNDFVDVVCGKGSFQDMTYVITRSGILCEFNGRRLLDRWVNVKTSCAFCITAGQEYLFIGCAESIIRCFSLSTLAFVTTLPRTHYLGVDVSRALNIAHTAAHPKDARYPDTVAVVYDEKHKKLACVYNDHSLYIWDIHDIKKVGKSNSYLYHCACIWGVETCPNVENSAVPPGSFITCSSDDTIRFWNLDKHKNNFSADSAYQPNIYSNELMKVIYIDPELQYIKNTDIGLNDKTENLSYDDRNGVRSMGISPDGQQLATGDRSGNIRVYGLKNVEEVCKIEAHDAEVLCLEYAPVIPNSNKRLLLSASRDRLIHVFDASDYYNFVETLDDHSSSITAIKFVDMNGQLQLVSCSADKSIIFRRYQHNKNGRFVRDRLLAGKSTLYDMAVDCTQKYILTACQDRNIRVYNVNNGKLCNHFKGSVGEEGSVIKVALDSSGKYLATSCTDKTLCIFDYCSGECVASMCGHSELVTGLRFSNDCERLVSASGDGCIFVWRLPRDMVVTMQARIVQQRARFSTSKSVYENSEDQMNEIMISSNMKQDIGRELNSDMRFNDGQLPLWAAKTENEESALISNANTRKMMPKGRWAQRITPFPQDGIFHLPSGRESDGSKEDSSVDSGTETSRPEDRHEKLIVPQKMIRSPPKFITVDDSTDRMDLSNTDKGMYRRSNTSNINDIQDMHRMRQHTDDSSLGSFKNEDLESTEHDGDIEDYSEVESAENEPNNKVMYYETVDDALSEFKVNAIDADELRKSQRKMKRTALAKKNPTLDMAAYSVSGSQESDDDDDEGGSTPSADNSEKANSLSLSSVDAFIQREKYLKGTYESLSGIEMDMKHNNSEYQDKKLTISSQHHSFNSDYKNQKIIQATIQTKNDIEANRKRQELQSRLEDIRGKLECAGHSSLKSSQSTMDLRRNETYFVPMSIHKPNNDFQGTRSSYNNAKPVSCHRESYNQPYYSPYQSVNGGTNVVNNLNYARKTNNLNCDRPNVLNISSCYANVKHNRLKNVNLSLPHSPVCDREFSSTRSDKSKKRYSCSFYIDFNSKNCPPIENQDAIKSEDDLDLSSDSLDDEKEEYQSPKMRRRRCISEYQLSWKDSSRRGNEEERRNYWNSSFSDINRSHSEENILNDDVDSLQDNSDRHSSASFFLRKRKAFNSSESILTDESEYQFLFSNKEVFRSTESILTDASDSNLNSVSDDMNLTEETTWSQVTKQPVLRTRSLQDTNVVGGELTKYFVAQKEKNQNRSCEVLDKLDDCVNQEPKKAAESFFIPVDSNTTARTPDDIKQIIMKKMNSRKRPESKNGDLKVLDHPVVVHKPPKPQNKSTTALNSKTYRKKVSSKEDKLIKNIKSSKNQKLTNKQANIIENINEKDKVTEKFGTFTKSKCNLGKNLLKNPINTKSCNTTKVNNTSQSNPQEQVTDYKVLNKNTKNEMLKRAVTITKYDADLINTSLTTKFKFTIENTNPELWKFKRHSLPVPFVSLSQLSDCFSPTTNDEPAATDNGDVGMRRSCSLSDLSGNSLLISPINQKKYGDKYSSYKNQDSGLHSSTPFSSPISRSSSEIALMPPPSHFRRPSRGENNPTSQRIMRPTISSQNKTKSSASSSKLNSNMARRRQSGSLSYMALNDVSNLEDSSSEDNKSDRPRMSAVFSDKQSLNKRSSKFLERSCSERDLSALSYQANKKRNHQLNEAKSEAQLFSSTIPDVNNTPLSRDLLNAVVEQFKKTAENIIRIHDRIAVENMNDAEKKMLLLSLRNTIGQVQNNLRSKFEPSEVQNELLNDNAAKSNNTDMSLPSDNMVSMIQQYSDVLVSIVQQKFDQKPM